MTVPYTFDTWQDHDSVQEAFIKTRPICIFCGGRVLEDTGIICMICIGQIQNQIANSDALEDMSPKNEME